jgi:myo-inositol-1(or 4)-monophosphatase
MTRSAAIAEPQPALADLKRLAKGAGAILRQHFGQEHRLHHKGVVDLVTDADHEAEDYLLAEVHRLFPTHAILSEEAGQLQGADGHCWYIDPLDGTTNFSHDLPLFSVSMAYARGGIVELGVVYDPIHDECFSAQLGKGAWLNGRRIHVSTTATLIDSLLVTGFPYDRLHTAENNLDNFAHFSMITQGVRRLGSAALDLGYIACGRLDGYWELKLNAWDIAAGALIAREAGGRVTSLLGEEEMLQPPYSVLAANPNIYPLMLAELRR